MECRRHGSGGAVSPNPLSRTIAKKTGLHCRAVDLHSSASDPAPADDHSEHACKPAGAAAVRVVQIFNPVLVKTDVANFPLLVQKLTGKSRSSKSSWSKLRRRLNYGDAMDVIDVELQELHADAGAGGLNGVQELQCSNGAVQGDDLEGSSHYTTRSEHSSIAAGAAGGSGAFSELDIYAGLVSDGPLPDITMLPPLLIHTRSELSLCT